MKKLLIAAVAILSVSFIGCSSQGASAPDSNSGNSSADTTADNAGAKDTGGTVILTMGTGDVGGTLYPVGSAIAKAVNDNVAGVKVNVETTSGSPDNARMSSSNEIQLGLCTGDVAYSAIHGEGAFEGNASPNIKALFPTFSSVSMWMSLDNSSAENVKDLVGKRVSVGMAGSAAEVASNVIFTALGESYPSCIDIQYLGVSEGCDAVRDGVILSHHAFGGFPQGGMLDLSNTKDAHLLAYDTELLDKITSDYSYYFKASVPAGTYKGQEENVDTFGVKCMLICNADMDEELAYNICKAAWENREGLAAGHASLEAMTEEFIGGDLPIELHPGALKYWKEVGVIK